MYLQAALLDLMEPPACAELLLQMPLDVAAPTVARMRPAAAAAAIGEHMETPAAQTMLEAVAQEDAQAAADVLAAMSKEARKRLLEGMEVELGAQLLALFKEGDRESALSMLSMTLAKQLRHLANARLRCVLAG